MAIHHGQPFAKDTEPRSQAEIFVIGVIYINAAPDGTKDSRQAAGLQSAEVLSLHQGRSGASEIDDGSHGAL